MGLLIVPKLLAWMLLLTQRQNRLQFGGALRVFVGFVVETFLSGLIAPVMMIFQSRAVGEILLGRDSGWQVQRRDDGGLPRGELMRKYALPTLFGLAMAAVAYAVSLPLLFWMAPVIAGLLLSVPVAMLSSAQSGPNAGLLLTPEQTVPPPVLVRANELATVPGSMTVSPLLDLFEDRRLMESHLANLPDDKRRNRGQVDSHLAIARAKIEDAETFDEALSYLTERETFAVLNSPTLLRVLSAMPRSGRSAAAGA
jgi:membrane glycosyltransferase